MHEVSVFDYYKGGRSSSVNRKGLDKNKDFLVCTGATYILIKVIGYIMKDHEVEE
jgi:hypothetical protein